MYKKKSIIIFIISNNSSIFFLQCQLRNSDHIIMIVWFQTNKMCQWSTIDELHCAEVNYDFKMITNNLTKSFNVIHTEYINRGLGADRGLRQTPLELICSSSSSQDLFFSCEQLQDGSAVPIFGIFVDFGICKFL